MVKSRKEIIQCSGYRVWAAEIWTGASLAILFFNHKISIVEQISTHNCLLTTHSNYRYRLSGMFFIERNLPCCSLLFVGDGIVVRVLPSRYHDRHLIPRLFVITCMRMLLVEFVVFFLEYLEYSPSIDTPNFNNFSWIPIDFRTDKINWFLQGCTAQSLSEFLLLVK